MEPPFICTQFTRKESLVLSTTNELPRLMQKPRSILNTVNNLTYRHYTVTYNGVKRRRRLVNTSFSCDCPLSSRKATITVKSMYNRSGVGRRRLKLWQR